MKYDEMEPVSQKLTASIWFGLIASAKCASKGIRGAVGRPGVTFGFNACNGALMPWCLDALIWYGRTIKTVFRTYVSYIITLEIESYSFIDVAYLGRLPLFPTAELMISNIKL